jgi:succinyl-CoA synthetase alpha subunit
MGHAGAIITGGEGGPEQKVEAFKAVGVPVADTISEIADKIGDVLGVSAGR